MGELTLLPVVDEGLGNSAYLLDLGDGRALAVDPSRDLRALRTAADRLGLHMSYAADTHLHADFLTGALELAASEGAQVLASAEGGREYPHTGLRDGDEVDLGGLTLRALSTPGHTHEHLTYQILDDARVIGVFTGGSLIVGAAARTDLVSPERTGELARAQYRSLKRLAELEDDVAVWPTHGAGSFCSAPSGAERTSTIGHERATNSLLGARDEDEFVGQLLGSLGTFPSHFRRLGEVNRLGPELVQGDEDLTALEVPEVLALVQSGAAVIDVRPVSDFAAHHVRGAISIALRPVFGTWLGWLVDPETPLVIVRNPDQDPAEIVWQAHKIGYDNIAGELAGGMASWSAAGQATGSIPLTTPERVDPRHVLDIRQDSEYRTGHLPGAAHIELGSLKARARDVSPEPTVVMCGHSERAMGAASILARAGRRDITVLDGGPEDWAAASGRSLETGA